MSKRLIHHVMVINQARRNRVLGLAWRQGMVPASHYDRSHLSLERDQKAFAEVTQAARSPLTPLGKGGASSMTEGNWLTRLQRWFRDRFFG
jgi:hypothetical protein